MFEQLRLARERESHRSPQNAIWKPHAGPQTIALQRVEEEVLYGGARGGGKTDAGIAWFTRWLHIPDFRGLVLRRNAEDLADWIDRATRLYGRMGGQTVGKPAEFRFPSGAKIRTGHLKDEDAYEKYQGHEYQKILIEELTQIPSLNAYKKLLGSNRSTVAGLRAQMFCTTNPGGAGTNWVKNRWGISGAPTEPIFSVDEETGHRLVFVPARVKDNPTLVDNDPTYLRFLDGLDPDTRKAWRDGNWDLFSGQFFALWNPQVHIVEPFEIPESWAKIRGIDPSGRNGNTSCHWYAIDTDGNVWVYREHYGTGMDADQHAKAIAKMSERVDGRQEYYRWTVIDSAAFNKVGMPETLAEVYERCGVVGLVPASKKRVEGWDFVNQHLRPGENNQPPKLRVFKNCKNLIRTLPMMISDEKKIGDLAFGQEDDCVDELRYVLQTLRGGQSQKPLTLTEKKLQEWRKSSKINKLDKFKYSRT